MFKECFKALAEPVRREILIILKNGRKNAGEISKEFNLTAPTVSYHLSLLKNADLIREIKVKNYIYYELNLSVFEELILWFNNFNGVDENVEKK
ncbi:autorepressor SdpR family transcription factor [Caviibacter abscessus]|uniref:autorepressor SdpR family transcription factor n=1 Tax=Caviibacter abscessus TaxID=1766719 RepID=UPI00082AB381|nr:autorepressor SdpR family transcription factor [Caviibacter abscessus]